jgi:hypothetical protein
MRNNGQINRGLPLDQWLVPKPMYDAIAQAMRNAPARQCELIRSLARVPVDTGCGPATG